MSTFDQKCLHSGHQWPHQLLNKRHPLTLPWQAQASQSCLTNESMFRICSGACVHCRSWACYMLTPMEA